MDVAQLKASANLIDVAAQYVELRKATQGEYCGPCPFCGGDDRFHVFIDGFFCRPGPGHCGRKGDAIDFIKEIKHVDFKEACVILGGGASSDNAPLKPIAHSANGHTEYVWDEEKRKAELLKSHEQLLQATAKGAQQCMAYLESRGLTLDTIKAFRLGYRAVGLPSTEGKQKELSVAIPWLDPKGHLIAVKYRFIDKHVYLDKDGKEQIDRMTSRGSNKDHAFGWQAIRNTDTLYIVEGEINAMSIWQASTFDVLSVGSMQKMKHLPDEIIEAAKNYKRVVVWSDEREFSEAAAKTLGATVVTTEQDANALLQADKLNDALKQETKIPTLPYDIQDGCIGEWRQRIIKGKSEDYFVPLCNFNAWIVADVAADDGEEITRKIAIAGQLATGQKLPEIEIEADEFEAMKWPVALWGARVSIEPIKNASNLLRAAMQRLSVNMDDRRMLTHTGWTVINGERVFLHANGAIGSKHVNVGLPRNLRNYSLPKDDTIDPVVAMRASIDLQDVAPARVSMPLWASMFLAPLSEIITPVFVVSVEGGSGSLKSSYTAVMLNHYGSGFSEYAMPADWLGTANSLEKLCFHAKDIPLVIDDLRPSTNQNEKRQIDEAVSRITRAAGNRQGRSRLDANSEFRREYVPRGVVLMTAERKALGKSVNSRIITLDVEPGDIDSLMLSQCQAQRHIYSYAMKGYIEWVKQNWNELSTLLPTQAAEIRASNSVLGQHKRLPNATATLYVAFRCGLNYAVEIGAISEDEAKQRLEHCYFSLQTIAENQNDSTEKEDPALKFLVIVASLIGQGKAHLLYRGANDALITVGSVLAEKLGWHDGEHVYLLPGAYNAVCKYATAEGWTFPSDEGTLRKELDRAGYITKKTKDRLTTKQRVPGEGKLPVNVLAISYDKFAEILTELGVDL